MIGVLIVTVTALILSIFLVLVNFFLNKIDKRVEDVLALLPGYNCGACGFGGCPPMAFEIVKNGVNPKRCKPIREEQYNKIIKYLEENGIN
jgi:Na+-translocating ferredoxin:NAD+ oxidoreductase subunit B